MNCGFFKIDLDASVNYGGHWLDKVFGVQLLHSFFYPLINLFGWVFFLAKSLLCQYISGYLSLSTFFCDSCKIYEVSHSVWLVLRKYDGVNNYFNLKLFCFIFSPYYLRGKEDVFGRFLEKYLYLKIWNIYHVLPFFYLLIHL